MSDNYRIERRRNCYRCTQRRLCPYTEDPPENCQEFKQDNASYWESGWV